MINDNIIEQVTDFGGTNFILRIKEQKTRLILNEHDDDDDDDDFLQFSVTHFLQFSRN